MKRFRWLIAAAMAVLLWSLVVLLVFAYSRWLAPML